MKKFLMGLSLLIFLPLLSYGEEYKKDPKAAKLQKTNLGFIIVKDKRLEKLDPRRIYKSDKDLVKELVQDEHDLLRNEVGVSVNEGGRAGSNGYSIRGVDADRVAVIVDGLPQAESFISFIYNGWGYMSGNINTTELENLSSVSIAKGADAFKVGSGALGGAVMFKTKEVSDFVAPGKNFGGLAKIGYTSKNKELRRTIGGGFRVPKFEGLVQYTHRYGHETINYGSYPDIYGSKREEPDPEDRKTESILAKLGYNFSGDHWIRGFLETRRQERKIEEKSFNGFSQHRYPKELSPYNRYGGIYEWMPQSTIFDNIELKYSHQDIDQHVISRLKDLDWKTGLEKPEVVEIKDRLIEQTLDSYELEANSKNILFGNTEHAFKFGSQYRENDFRNTNHDTWVAYGGVMDDYTIITPVDTKYYNFRLQDTIFWTSRFETVVGLRYDHYEHKALKDEILNPRFSVDEIPEGTKTFQAPTWFASLSYGLTGNLTVQYKIGTAFRAPKALEMYFKFGKDLSANQVDPNPDLNPEKALNQEIALMFENETASATLTAFYTRYTDFIEDRHTVRQVDNPWYPLHTDEKYLREDHFQFVNVDNAKVYGAEFAGALNLNQIAGFIPAGTNMSLNMSIAKGETSLGDGMRALQPFKAVMGLGYDSPQNKWGIKFTTRYLGKKSSKDTERTEFLWSGPAKRRSQYLNDEAFVSDVRAYFNLLDKITISAGINNIFNKRYHTWESLRSIPEYGTTNMVDSLTGAGLQRFTAPERNFSIAVEYRF